MADDSVRTRVVLDLDLVERGFVATGLKSRHALIDLALRELLRRHHGRDSLGLESRVERIGDPEPVRQDRVP